MSSNINPKNKKVKSLGIGGKLIIIFLTLSVSITIILSIVSYISGSSAISHKATALLSAAAELKTEIVVDFLELLPPHIVIQRLTGDPPRKSELVAPAWAVERSGNLNLIRQRLEERKTWQGRLSEKFIAGS